MTDSSKLMIVKAFLAKEGLQVVAAPGSSHPEGLDLDAKLLEIVELAEDMVFIDPIDPEAAPAPDAWDDAITAEYKVPAELLAKAREG